MKVMKAALYMTCQLNSILFLTLFYRQMTLGLLFKEFSFF